MEQQSAAVSSEDMVQVTPVDQGLWRNYMYTFIAKVFFPFSFFLSFFLSFWEKLSKLIRELEIIVMVYKAGRSNHL